jgi:hypothetical protein
VEGKLRSSQNARVHGCTSRTLLLPNESAEEYEALRGDWLADFSPAAPTALELVEQTAQAHWLYLRVLKQWDALEAAVGLDPLAWSEQQCKMRDRLGRYRTAAERSFQRALTAIEARRKSRQAEFYREARLEQAGQRIELSAITKREQMRLAEERLAFDKAEAERRAEERREERAVRAAASAAAAKKRKKNTFGVAEQWLEVRVTDGVTTTEFIPSNEELLQEIAKKMDQGEDEPAMVYRRMNFPDGVPPEYGWTNAHDMAACELTAAGKWCEGCARFLHGGHGIQRMTFRTWQEVIAREAERADGHAGPTGVGNLPRPKERGGEVSFEEMRAWVGEGVEVEDDLQP